MPKKIPIFYSALLLTGVNLLLRLVGTSFQVYISSRLGPAGVGLLQLVLSVGSLALVAGIAGIRTAAMYLTAEELGRKQEGNVTWVLSGCFLYSILCSSVAGTVLYIAAPWIAEYWLGDGRTLDALRLLAAFLPVTCLCGVMTGYFTAANRIGTLAAVEVAEQLCSMFLTLTALKAWGGTDPGRACLCVVLGSSLGACVTLLSLVLLRLHQRSIPGKPIPVARRLIDTALPLGASDVLKAGINTTENLMVPKRLALCSLVENPLAAFGLVSGMVFPVIMFPACILFGLAELLIPELARCAAAGSEERIHYLVRKSLRIALLYGVFFSGGIVLLAEPICIRLYGNTEACRFMQLYGILIPMLYCDAITDAMTKGLGQQRACVRYNILTSALDVILLYLMLPKYGMMGYFVSFVLTHLLNFLLSLRRLLTLTGLKLPFQSPALTLAAAVASVWGVSGFSSPGFRIVGYTALLGSLLYLLQVISKEDLRWVKGLVIR